MSFLPDGIQAYAEAHTSAENELLRKVNRDTNAHILRPRMLSGHLQGRFLSMISCILRPSRILEIGTYTGYSALCLAEGLTSDGKLITIDVNEELEDPVRKTIAASNFRDCIDFRIGNALTLLKDLNETFDLVFIDADKENYSAYFDLVFPKVNVGGVILADNVLWSGKVLNEKLDKDTAALVEFNRKIQQDQRVQNVLLPIRDGVMMIRKVSL